MKNILILIMGMFLLVSMVGITEAQVQFWQKNWQGDGVGSVPINTTRSHASITYDKDTNDYIKKNNPLDVVVLYDVSITDWNNQNPSYHVESCNFSVAVIKSLANNSVLLHNQVFTENYNNARYFIQLNDGDSAYIDMDCKFDGNLTSLYMPSSFQISTPTWECKACQYYEWSVEETKVVKIKTIGEYIIQVSENIKYLIELNYEIWLIVFWFLMIAFLVHASALIFFGIIWLFLYLRSLIQ